LILLELQYGCVEVKNIFFEFEFLKKALTKKNNKKNPKKSVNHQNTSKMFFYVLAFLDFYKILIK
jgi:hypothetical protein